MLPKTLKIIFLNMIKRVLVTGGQGYIGGFIANALSNIYEVLTPSHQELDLQNTADVEKWFDNNQVDAVIHCALTGREVLFSVDPVYLSDGLLMFRNLWLQKHRFQSLINLGTAYEFDLNRNNSLVHEEEFINHLPTTSYGYAKNLTARVIRDTENFYNLRLFGIFHETESDQRFFKRVVNQDQIVINNDQFLDYMYLPDIMPMIKCILEGNAQHRDINMVYPYKYRLSELAYQLCDHLGLSRDKISIAGYNECDLTGNSSRLESYKFDMIGVEQGLRNY